MNKSKNPLELLQKIQQQEVPDFLFTRIHSRIDYQENRELKWQYSFLVGLGLSVLIQFFIINTGEQNRGESTFSSTSIHLYPDTDS
jgi:hypothetical protein